MNSPSEFPVLVDEATRDCEAQRCWSRIGVHGDRSCPEIPKYVHCRNCPVYIQAGAHLFDREPPREWLDEHKTRLAEVDTPLECDTITVLIFRLGDEYLALDVCSMLEVAAPRTVHRVPHRTGGNLEGIVNIRGEVQLCISLARLLSLSDSSSSQLSITSSSKDGADAVDGDQAAGKARFLVAEHGRQRWVFPVDEVLGVHRLSLQNRTALPATLRRSSSRLSRHVYDWNGLHVCHLDADRLFAAMQKGLQ